MPGRFFDYYMFPLAKGLPVSLTDHLDRSPEKNLLRGRLGKIVGWILAEEDDYSEYEHNMILKKLPKVVFVRFEDAHWQIDGLPKGVYPVQPKKKRWALDKNRPMPRLKIDRCQLPLSPAFAMTAHASQGQTLEAAIVDVCIGKEANPVTSYVALTRVKSRKDMLIYRPFPREIFCSKRLLTPEILIKHLKKEAINWSELADNLKERIDLKKTAQGEKRKYKETEDKKDMEKDTGKRQCVRCGTTKTEINFASQKEKRCSDCTFQECSCCKKTKPRSSFAPQMMHSHCSKKRRKCLECTKCEACDRNATQVIIEKGNRKCVCCI